MGDCNMNMRSRDLKLIVSLFLIIITLAVFWQVRNHEFINYDDDDYVTKNRYVQAGWTWEGVSWRRKGVSTRQLATIPRQRGLDRTMRNCATTLESRTLGKGRPKRPSAILPMRFGSNRLCRGALQPRSCAGTPGTS